jgi:hypothetical protein
MQDLARAAMNQSIGICSCGYTRPGVDADRGCYLDCPIAQAASGNAMTTKSVAIHTIRDTECRRADWNEITLVSAREVTAGVILKPWIAIPDRRRESNAARAATRQASCCPQCETHKLLPRGNFQNSDSLPSAVRVAICHVGERCSGYPKVPSLQTATVLVGDQHCRHSSDMEPLPS